MPSVKLPLSASTLRGSIKDYTFILLGIFFYSVGFTIFILPHDIVTGGMAGFSTLVYYFSGTTIPVAVTMYGANMLLLVAGFRVLGRTFVIRTLFGMTVISIMIGAMEGYFTSHPPLVASMPMSVAFGSVLCGLGIGMYYSHGGTTGGTDIVAAIMTHRGKLSLGRVMMIVDISIVALSFFLPFAGDMEARIQSRVQTMLLGGFSIVVYSFIADRYVGAGKQTVQFFILSDAWEEIAYRITHETGRGVTIWDAKGYWTGTSRTMMLVWCRQSDTYKIYNIVKQTDENAYITGGNVRSVYGNGFDYLTLKKPDFM